MQQGDYNSYYQYPHHPNLNPNPNPVVPHPTGYASAPPFSGGYSAVSDSSAYSSSYPPPYSHNPDPIPTAPFSTSTSAPPPLPQQQPPYYDSHMPYQPPAPQYYPAFDQLQNPPNFTPPANPNPTPVPTPPFYSAPYSANIASSAFDNNMYDAPPKFDHVVGVAGGSYFDNKYDSMYSRSRSDLGPDPYGKRSYDSGSRDDMYGDGVYAYEGNRVEPYGARGTAPKSSTWTQFDDYGRPIGKDSPVGSGSSLGSGKIVRAVPKADTQQDVKSGVQKFRVKLLAESGGQSTMDVLCQIGLDGIRMLDPNTSRTLRIYPLENITRCDKMDSSTFAFWSKSSVDIEPRRIRLQSNSYTTNTLLDTVTAATVQLKEMGGAIKPSDSVKSVEQPTERKRFDWTNLIKPAIVEKDHWVPDEAVNRCTPCGTDFSAFVRRHHCRNCGDIFCDKCTHGRIALTSEENAPQVRVCDRCLAEVTHRLSNAKAAANKQPAGFQSHEDLAKKLQEEMERNRKSSSGSKSDVSGKRTKEVACPTCTVHLQVQVPSSGSETIECGVCQHPFLVSAH